MFYENTMDREKVAAVLKNSILKKYGSISEYARLTGQEDQKVRSWTRGKRLPEVEDIVATCNILDIPLEYALVGTNRDFEKEELTDDEYGEEDEYGEKARCTCPNLIFADAALLFPLIGMPIMMSIIYRAGDCRDSFYIYNLFRTHIKTDSNAWKYCVYVLQQRNSLLVDQIEKIEADTKEIMEWGGEYEKEKRKFFEQYEAVKNAVYQILQAFPKH